MRLFRDHVTDSRCHHRLSLPPRRAPGPILALALAIGGLLPPAAQALGLGRLAGEAVIGDSLQLTVPLTGSIDRPLDQECLTLARPAVYLEAEYFPRDLKARIETREGSRQVVLATASALRQPLVEFRINIGCGYNLYRDYLLMASPRKESKSAPQAAAMGSPVPAPATAPAPPPAAKSLPDGIPGRRIVLDRDQSLRDLARQHFPGPLRQERFMRWVAEANPGLFAGIADRNGRRLAAGQELVIPVGVPPRRPEDNRTTDNQPPPATQATPQAATAAMAADVPAASRSPRQNDRLVIGGDGGAPTSLAEARDMVDKLTTLMERQTAVQAASDERIRSLEAALAELAGTVAQVEAGARQREARWQAQWEEQRRLLTARPDLGWLQLFLAIVVGGAIGAGLLQAARLLAARRPQPPFPETIAADSPRPGGDLPVAWDELLTTPPSAAKPAAARQTAAPSRSGKAFETRQRPALDDLDFPLEFEPPVSSPPAPAPSFPAAAPPAPGAAVTPPPARGSFMVEPAASDPAAAAIELADIMVSMGLAESAAQTLVEHIRDNPRQSLHHWLKLLELHRLNGNRQGFDDSVEELRQHFNIEAPDWDWAATAGARDSVEAYPHLRAHLIRHWRQPDCAAFLQTLLLDNREGTRAGFPLAVAEEILLLIAILSTEA